MESESTRPFPTRHEVRYSSTNFQFMGLAVKLELESTRRFPTQQEVRYSSPNFQFMGLAVMAGTGINTSLSNLTEVYYPAQQLSVDESIMPCRRRGSFRQFIPSKPVPYGMKLYCCCESSSGYICSMKQDTGKEGGQVEHGHGPNVVKYVTKDFLQKGHTICMDSFFPCVTLHQELLQENTAACGTLLRHPKGNPEAPKSKSLKLAKAEFAVQQNGPLIAMRFHDRKDCMFLNIIHTAKPVSIGKRKRSATGEEVDVNKPKIVHKYNQSMGGVDTMDQHLSYYAFNQKTMRRWKRAATHLIHTVKVQARILYRK